MTAISLDRRNEILIAPENDQNISYNGRKVKTLLSGFVILGAAASLGVALAIGSSLWPCALAILSLAIPLFAYQASVWPASPSSIPQVIPILQTDSFEEVELVPETLNKDVEIEPAEELSLKRSDWVVALTNGLRLTGAMSGVAAPVMMLGRAWGAVERYRALPANTSKMEKAALVVSLLGREVLQSIPVVHCISTLGSAYYVAKRALPEIGKAWTQSGKTPFRALGVGAVHAFNLATESVIAANSVANLLTPLVPPSNSTAASNPPAPSKTKNPCFTVAMTYDNRGQSRESDYSELTKRNHELFAKNNKAHFICDTDPIQLKCWNPVTTKEGPCVPYWRKVELVDKWIREPERPECSEEWIVYGDDDGVYGDMNLKLSQVVKDLGGSDKSLIIAKDAQPQSSMTNTGVFMVRKDGRSQKFVAEWLNRRDRPSLTPNDPVCPTLGTCPDQRGGFHEQTAFNQLIEESPFGAAVSIVPVRDSEHRNYGVNSFFRSGIYKKQLSDPYWINYDEDDSEEGRAQRGDFFMQASGVPRMGVMSGEENSPPSPLRKKYIGQMLSQVVDKKYNQGFYGSFISD